MQSNKDAKNSSMVKIKEAGSHRVVFEGEIKNQMNNKKEWKGTKGNWEANRFEVRNHKGMIVATTYDHLESNQPKDTSEANAKLIADAGTTINKCGLMPSELLHENERLKEAINGINQLGLTKSEILEKRIEADKLVNPNIYAINASL